jgi:hypothetical protein
MAKPQTPKQGKSCVRCKRAEDLPLGLISEAVARVPVDLFRAQYEKAVPPSKRKKRPTAR